MRYYVQFPAGTGALVRESLPPLLGNLRVAYADDSAMIVESSASPTTVASVPFVKNAFVVLAATPRGEVDRGVSQLGRIARKAPFPTLPGPADTFRVMAHLDGTLTSVGAGARSSMERAIAERTGQRVAPRGLGQEFWVVGRRGLDDLLLCARLPRAKKPQKSKGSVSVELAAMLVAASRPAADDEFLDPFAGSGSLVAARLGYPAQHLWASDLHLREHRDELRELARNKRVRLLAEDALALPSFADRSVDVVVTDPPWGEYEAVEQPYDVFAAELGRSLARVLHPVRGRFVLLVNRRNAALLRAGLSGAGLLVAGEHDILVNGHPASVLVGGRQGRCQAGLWA